MKTLSFTSLLVCAGLTLCSSVYAQKPAVKSQPARPQATKTVAAKPAAKPTAKPTAKPQGTTVAKAQAAPAAQPVASAKEKEVETQAQPTPVETPKESPKAEQKTKTKFSLKGASGRNKYLNAGIGFGSYGYGGLPIGASFEVDLKNNISVGGSFDYARYGYRSYGYRWNYNFIYVGARGSYHFGEILNVGNDKFDPYAGISVGFRHASYSDNTGYDRDYVNPYNSGIYMGIHLGSRYMFSEKFGGFAEVGYGVAALRLGVTAKF